MNTEQHIREAFDKWHNNTIVGSTGLAEQIFTAGYLALLNELEPFTYYDEIQTYRLPEVVTKP